jgi:hypothetical protein
LRASVVSRSSRAGVLFPPSEDLELPPLTFLSLREWNAVLDLLDENRASRVAETDSRRIA